MTRTRRWLCVLALAGPHLAIYWRHYFGSAGIPWDFSLSYFGMVAFWTSLVREGTFPQWIPFQQMGYPFALQAQSGMNYLPLWFFPAVDLPYTLRAAVIFQCLHALAGSVGMFLLVRHAFSSTRTALIGAMAFQYFGGFFSNAEHPDIIRAYAWSPWLLFAFSLDNPLADTVPRRAWLAPPLLYLFLTGAYPGNVIAGGLMITAFLAFQACEAWAVGSPVRRIMRSVGVVTVLGALGVGMAAIHLGPLFLFRDDFVRGNTLASVTRVGLWLQQWPGLFLSNATIPGEISMTSTYVTLPVLILACFTGLEAIRRHGALLAVGSVAAVMAAGDHTPIAPLLRGALPVLGLSRFPSSDYRVFVAIAIVLLACSGVRAIADGVPSRRRMIFTASLVVLWSGAGIWAAHREAVAQAALAGAMVVASLGAMVWLWHRRRGVTLAIVVVGTLMAVDAVRVLPDMPGWNEPDMEAYYPRQGSPPYSRNRGRRLASSLILGNTPARRPGRENRTDLARWSGYINGRFYVHDLTPNVLRASARVVADQRYLRFMLQPWTPILLPLVGTAPTGRTATVSESLLAEAIAAPVTEPSTAAVAQKRYGVNDIAYEVDLTEPRLLVENEMYFPGWRARLDQPGAPELEAVEVNGLFRAWRLPAGRYAMTAFFAFPHMNALRGVTAASAVTWLVLWISYRRRETVHASQLRGTLTT